MPVNKPPSWKYKAEVVEVIDGDTLDVRIRWDIGFNIETVGLVRVRLLRVNAPETNRPAEKAAGLAAKAWLTKLLPPGSVIEMDTSKGDAFGRWLAEVTLPSGENLSDRMLAEGHARPYSR